jgi:hypothetical protein
MKLQLDNLFAFVLWLAELLDIKEDNPNKRLISELRIVFFGMKS